jgi:hypothetical protein
MIAIGRAWFHRDLCQWPTAARQEAYRPTALPGPFDTFLLPSELNKAVHRFGGSSGSLARFSQQSFELCEDLFARIEIVAVGGRKKSIAPVAQSRIIVVDLARR